MDALSDVLRVVRLKGGVFLHAEFSAPWCILSQVAPEDCGAAVEGAEHLVLYHYVVEGRGPAVVLRPAEPRPVRGSDRRIGGERDDRRDHPQSPKPLHSLPPIGSQKGVTPFPVC